MPFGFKFSMKISKVRFKEVEEDITDGSEPKIRFYIMVSVSTMIAAFGLLSNSTAVVIGAMLVAPLMTPIFGMALALVRGDRTLMGRATRAEIMGVILSVFMGFLLGAVVPVVQATPEMLARTSPHLLDLMVAVLSGFAGAYAMVDEKMSPTLPGVAIATAIVPPLANSGLCFAFGAYEGAFGSLLLFFANFLAILLVASATFVVCGMARGYGTMAREEIHRRFALAAVGFLVVAFFLGSALLELAERQKMERTIKTVLKETLSDFPATSIDQVKHEFHEDKLYVMAVVHSPNVLSPLTVASIEKSLDDKLEEPTELIIRTIISHDVASYGSTSRVGAQDLDGFFLNEELSPTVRKINLAEQMIREYFATRLGLYLQEVDLLDFGGTPVLLASIYGIRMLNSEEFGELEKMVCTRVEDPEARLLIRYVAMEFHDANGQIHYEWANPKKLAEEENATVERIKAVVKAELEPSDTFYMTNLRAAVSEGVYHVLLEVGGVGWYAPEQVNALQRKLEGETEKTIKLYVWSRPETLATESGFSSYREVSKNFYEEREGEFLYYIRKMLDASR